MKIISNNDAYADTLSTAAFATIPFITIGVMGMPVVMWIAIAIGIILFSIFLIRFCLMMYKDLPPKPSGKLDSFMSMMQIPYATALSGLILMSQGLDAQPVLWLALAISIGSVLLVLFYCDF